MSHEAKSDVLDKILALRILEVSNTLTIVMLFLTHIKRP